MFYMGYGRPVFGPSCAEFVYSGCWHFDYGAQTWKTTAIWLIAAISSLILSLTYVTLFSEYSSILIIIHVALL